MTPRSPLILTAVATLALMLTACSKPAPPAEPSDAAALIEPASAVDTPPASSSPIQVAESADAADMGAPASQVDCHQVQVGGGYQPGLNGAPGMLTPGQTMTVCSAPTPSRPVSVAPAVPLQQAAPARALPAPDPD